MERLGYSFDELQNQGIQGLFDIEMQDKNIKRLFRTFEETTLDTTFTTKEGVWIDVTLSTYVETSGGETIGLLVAKDLSDLRKAYEELHYIDEELVNQRENFQALIDNLTQTQEQLIQSEKMAALGQLISGIAHEINTPLGAIKASIGNLEDSIDRVWYDIQSAIKFFTEDEINFIRILLEWPRSKKGLTSREKRRIRKELTTEFEAKGFEKADRMAELFVYLEVYEDFEDVFNTIEPSRMMQVLPVVRDFYSLYKNKNTINIATERASVVVFALKKFIHHDQSGEMNSADVVDGIETVLTLYHNQIKQGIEIVKNYCELQPILAYHDEINQVWTNLIHNALQAMGQTGTLTITTTMLDEHVKVGIEDTGSGIAPDMKDKIFTPFFTTKKKGEGSGIGLDIVKKIIDRHKGNIYFESTVDKGTTFYVELPLDPTIQF